MIRRIALILSLLCLNASAANLIPNSSFEVGVGRGWLNYSTSDNAFLGNAFATSTLITNQAFHGNQSFIARGLTYSRQIWLQAGSYMFSIYAQCSSAGSGPFYYGVMDGANLYTVNPPSSANIAGTWTRYTSAFTASSNAFYWVKFMTFQADVFEVDALQLETGGSATTYAPQAQVEAGLSVTSSNSMWFSGSSPSFTINYWNDGSATNLTVRYQVFDLWNSNIVSGLPVAIPASGSSASTISLPSKTGWFRVVSRILNFNDSQDEATLIVYPFSSNTVYSASLDWLGGHFPSSPYEVNRAMMGGWHNCRTLSPDYAATRWDYIQPTNGPIQFNDFAITNLAAGGMNILGTLTPRDGYWNEWATNIDGTASMDAFSNYCYQVVNRYKTYCTNWEIGPNEPYQSGPTTPINVQIATNYAQVLTAGIRGVTNADATARIIGVAGASGNGDWGKEAITNLSAGSQAAVYAVSTHQYPDDNPEDPNASFDVTGRFTNPYGWMTNFPSTPVWNTESGTYNLGPTKINTLWPSLYNVQTTPALESSRSEIQNRQTASTVRILTEALRCIGYGMKKIFYYDGRPVTEEDFVGVQPHSRDYLQVDRPEAVTLSIAQSMVTWGFGRVVNVNEVALEMYMFTNSAGNPVIALWNYDRTNRTVTITNSGFTVYDCNANQVQANSSPITTTRFPQYLVTTTLTMSQLSNTLKHATMVGVLDATPPAISVDLAPSGVWGGDTTPQLIKWTALDYKWTAWTTTNTATNVLYKWKMDTGSYSTYSQSNHAWPVISSGNHTLYVSAMDGNGNAAETSYEFGPPASDITMLNLGGGHPLLLKKKTSLESLPRPVNPCDVSPYLVKQDFETPTTGYDHCESWTEAGTGTYTNNPAYTAVVLAGNQSFQHYVGAGTATAFTACPSNAEVWFYALVRPVTLPAGSTRIVTLLGGGTGGSGILNINASGQLSVAVDGQAAFATTVDGLAAGTTYNVWVRIKTGTTAGPIAATVGFSTNGTKPVSGNKYAQNLNNPLYDSGVVTGVQLGGTLSSTKQIIFDNVRVSASDIGDNPP